MKKKIILILFVILIAVIRMVDVIAANELVVSEDLDAFCQYQGILDNLAKVEEEEFKMLLEPPNYPNFQSMNTTISRLLEQVSTSEKHLEMLRNPRCNISKYTKKLLLYYEANKEKIEKNVRNIGKENSEQDVISMLESLKDVVGAGFLSVMTLNDLSKQMQTACQIHRDNRQNVAYRNRKQVRGGTNCHNTAALTLMELIKTVQMLTEEIEWLKHQRASSSQKRSICKGGN